MPLIVDLVATKRPQLRFAPASADNKLISVPQYEAVAMFYVIAVLRDLFGLYGDLDLLVKLFIVSDSNQFQCKQNPLDIIAVVLYCKHRYLSGQNIIAFCSNQQYF